MPRKKTEEKAETTTEATPDAAVTSEETSTETQSAAAAGEETASSSSIIGSLIDTVSSAVETVASTAAAGVASVATTITDAVGLTGGEDEAKTNTSRRAQRIGVVTSDKMTKTVVVRVDRLIKHPKYRRYVRRKKQFMAHDELGATTGDKVRIVETRPLSARKRWRVIEIVQKAAK
jgi:small subunit ribosomal protein S17